MMGKILAGVIVVTALIVGGAMYYFQVYGFYEPIPASVQGGNVRKGLRGLTRALHRSATAPVLPCRCRPR
jgi:hypothetical protein